MNGISLLLVGTLFSIASFATVETIYSPDKKLKLTFTEDNGTLFYSLKKYNREVIKKSLLGVMIRDRANLSYNMQVNRVIKTSTDLTWEQAWGENRYVRDNHNRLLVKLSQKISPYLEMNIEFKLFNDGLGFRYIWPKQKNMNFFEIWDENTEFVMRENDNTLWVPAFKDNRYEYIYQWSKLKHTHVVHTPFTIKTENNFAVAIHEAALIDYASMALKNFGGGKLKADLVPWSDGIRVRAHTPHQSSWRTIQIGDRDKDLLESNLILNLNEPNKLADTSWIETGKYVGIWWSMHLGQYTWGSGPIHGATTKNTKRYMDFAAKHGFKGVLVEGWNHGWDGNWYDNGKVFKFNVPYRDYDMAELKRHSYKTGVRVIGHHETSASTENYESQLEDAYKYLADNNINAVKTGYVGTRLDKREWHHGQYAVRHYLKALKMAAKHKVMQYVHEPIKQTGLRRTYPNLMATEGARGQEYNAWAGDGGNPPSHTPNLVFTRMLAGPMDFTPGIFDLHFDHWRPHNRVQTTLAKQLALYVVLFSPWQMAADLIENYENKPAFQFIKDVPTNWEKSIALNGRIGQYATFARKDRDSKDWYIGSITDHNGRNIELDLSFLDNGTYEAQIYKDAHNANWSHNAYPMDIYKQKVNKSSKLKMYLAPGGGFAIRLKKI